MFESEDSLAPSSLLELVELIASDRVEEETTHIVDLMRYCAQKFGAQLFLAGSPLELDFIVEAQIWDTSYRAMRIELIKNLTATLHDAREHHLHASNAPPVALDKVFREFLGHEFQEDIEAHALLLQTYTDALATLMSTIDTDDDAWLPPDELPGWLRAMWRAASSADACHIGLWWIGFERREHNALPPYEARRWLWERLVRHTREHLRWLVMLTEEPPPEALGLEPIDISALETAREHMASVAERIAARRQQPDAPRRRRTLIPDAYASALERGIDALDQH